MKKQRRNHSQEFKRGVAWLTISRNYWNLRSDLFTQYNPMEHQEAKDREESLADELRTQGYAVWQH